MTWWKPALIGLLVSILVLAIGESCVHLWQDHLLVDKIRTINEVQLQQQYDAVVKWQDEQKRGVPTTNAR